MTTILVNETAGALALGSRAAKLRAAAKRCHAETELEIVPTRSPEEMVERLRALVRDGAERIGVAGGDGTIDRAAQELAGTDVALGIVPLGTANNFASCAGVPAHLEQALATIVRGRITAVDLGRVGDRYFAESAGVGFFADALAAYGPQSIKSPRRLIAAITHAFLAHRSYELMLWLDGERHEERVVMCTAANCYRMAFSDPIAPGARLGDGRLDVVIIGDLSRLEIVRYYWAVHTGRHLGLPKVLRRRVRELRVEATRPVVVRCDDSIMGYTPVTMSVAAGALHVVVPAETDPRC